MTGDERATLRALIDKARREQLADELGCEVCGGPLPPHRARACSRRCVGIIAANARWGDTMPEDERIARRRASWREYQARRRAKLRALREAA